MKNIAIQRDAHENMHFISYSHWIVAKYDLPGLIEKLPSVLLFLDSGITAVFVIADSVFVPLLNKKKLAVCGKALLVSPF